MTGKPVPLPPTYKSRSYISYMLGERQLKEIQKENIAKYHLHPNDIPYPSREDIESLELLKGTVGIFTPSGSLLEMKHKEGAPYELIKKAFGFHTARLRAQLKKEGKSLSEINSAVIKLFRDLAGKYGIETTLSQINVDELIPTIITQRSPSSKDTFDKNKLQKILEQKARETKGFIQKDQLKEIAKGVGYKGNINDLLNMWYETVLKEPWKSPITRPSELKDEILKIMAEQPNIEFDNLLKILQEQFNYTKSRTGIAPLKSMIGGKAFKQQLPAKIQELQQQSVIEKTLKESLNQSKEQYDLVFKIPSIVYERGETLANYISELSKYLDPNVFKIKSARTQTRIGDRFTSSMFVQTREQLGKTSELEKFITDAVDKALTTTGNPELY